MNTDLELKEAVLEELAWEPSVTPAHIGVAVHNGVVTLSGHVASFTQKRDAEVATWRVKGVKAIAEELEVRLPSDINRGDEEIATAAVSQLRWNSLVPRDAVKVTVQQGWLTLTGQVQWHFESDAAADAVRTLWGVKGLTNNIALKPHVNAADLTAQIQKALHRSWFNSKNVSVTADGGKITLNGTVHSSNDRYLAATTAWAAPGATAVMNEIVVGG